MTPGAFRNAVTAILSVSGSINSVKHLQAVAAEAECDVDVYGLFERLADDVPLLTAIRPNGETPIEDFEDAGGTRAVMKQLAALLDTEARTVTGKTVAQNLDGVTVADDEVIRPPARALGRRPTIVLIRGSLCPDGGIVKLAVADDRRLDFAGPAIVFESPLESLDAVRGGPGQARPGRGAARAGRHRLPRHGHGLPARVRPRRRRADRPGRGRHRRAAVRPGEQGHRGRRGVAGGGQGRPAGPGRRRRHRSASTCRAAPPTWTSRPASSPAGRRPCTRGRPRKRSAGCRSTSAWSARCPRARC